MLWSLVASLSAGNGALSDLDALRVDPVGCELLGLRQAPSGRRLGEYLSRFGAAGVDALQGVARDLSRQLAPTALAHEVATRGYVPVFVDGSAIEVDGALFEGAGKGYDGTMQYWLHGVFVGSFCNQGLHGHGIFFDCHSIQPHDAGVWPTHREDKFPEILVLGDQYAVFMKRKLKQALVRSRCVAGISSEYVVSEVNQGLVQ